MEDACPAFATFRELEKKEIVNCSTGERLGFICDAEIDMKSGEVKYFTVPVHKDAFGLKAKEWKKFAFSDIERIGDDLILISRSYPCTRKVPKRKKLL